jgi:hypothetical protein
MKEGASTWLAGLDLPSQFYGLCGEVGGSAEEAELWAGEAPDLE